MARRIEIKGHSFKEIWSYFSNAQKIAFITLFSLAVLSGVIIPALLPSSAMRQIELSHNYRPGELSDEDVYSPVSVSFVDEVATERARDIASKAILPSYSYNFADSLSRINLVRNYTSSFAQNSLLSPDQILESSEIIDRGNVTNEILSLDASKLRVVTNLISDIAEKIIRNGIFSSQDLENSKSEGYIEISVESFDEYYNQSTSVKEIDGLMTSEGVYEYVIDELYENYPDIEQQDAILIAKAVRMLSMVNITYDVIETENLRAEASAMTAPTSIRLEEGDLIIARDTIITEQQLRIIDQINNMRASFNGSSIIANILFLTAILLFSSAFIISSIQYKYRIPLYMIIFLSGFILILILCSFLMRFVLLNYQRVQVDSILPILYLPLLFTCMTNKRRIGFSIGFAFASFAMLFPTSNKYSFFLFIAIIEASVLFVHRGTNRIDVIYEALYSSVIAAFATAVFSLVSGSSYDVLASNILFVILNVLVSFILVSVTLPIIEKVFNLPTQFRLHELSYGDTPTLNRLSQVAQGTFNHVRNVADMSYAAAKEIGADAELTRVGALYHDIGKAEHPEYFIENQGGKGNIHDELNNNLSAAIIKSHVKLGVEKGREIGLPQEVLDIIGQHHGNDIITYFYNEAKKNSPDGGRLVREEDFRYTGDIPQTPEAAIVMLADCTEAASRTLKNPNTQKYDRLIMNIIISKINHNQMNDSDLTLTDMMKIKDTFIRQLVGRDHQRIEYDKD